MMDRETAFQALAGLRDRIDEIDRQLIELLNRRTSIVEEIGRIKHDAGLPVYEPRREDQVFENVTRHNAGPLTHDGVRRVFERIIDESRQVQRLRIIERDNGSKS
jgi:chorismate mutase